MISETHRHRQREGFPSSDSEGKSQTLQWVWLGMLVLAVALLGGSSRPDPIQNAMLRPMVALMLIPTIHYLTIADLRRARALLISLGALTVWMVLQLIPLPPTVWQALPGRQVIANLDRLAGFEGQWRPISVAPFRGLNSALGLIVPITAVLMALALKSSARLLLFAIVIVGLMNASLGLLQVIGGAESPLYLYTITSRDAPSGLFANENHSAVFSAIVLLIITRLALGRRESADRQWIRFALSPAFLLVLLAVLVTGSRAGLMATVLALMAASVMTWSGYCRIRDPDGKAALRRSASAPLASLVTATLLAILVFIWFERTPALKDVIERSSFEDLRWSLLPVLGQMMSDHWLLGTGFGSFDAIYRAYEPATLLLPQYVNHAHNDWAQLVIEGGLPATLLLAAFLFWTGRALWKIGVQHTHRRADIIFWVSCVAIICGASLVDYPLRTPIFQLTLVWLILCLSADEARKNPFCSPRGVEPGR